MSPDLNLRLDASSDAPMLAALMTETFQAAYGHVAPKDSLQRHIARSYDAGRIADRIDSGDIEIWLVEARGDDNGAPRDAGYLQLGLNVPSPAALNWRAALLVEAADAWEYAISVDGWTGRVIQARSRQDSRDSPALVVPKEDASTFSDRVPRRLLRGDPADWGFAVVVMGRSLAGSAPMAVAVEPGPDRFGGAVPNRSAPPYIDLLVPPGLTQRRILGVYKSGQDVTLPFVRAEQ